MPTIRYPSLEAYKRAKGAPARGHGENPLAKFHEVRGYWLPGSITEEDGGKPRPDDVVVTDKATAIKLAAKGGRPIADADPEMKAMLVAFYEGRTEIPEIIASLKPKPAQAAK
jgi:hypothetical protein